MNPVVVALITRAPLANIVPIWPLGVSTTHEAMGRAA
jgi:hypothetical protein